MKRIGVYPGTFDPITKGHLDIIRRASRVVDHLVILIAPSTKKKPLFSLEKRIELAEIELKSLNISGEAQGFDGLLVEHMRTIGANVILRGLRAISDYEYELQIASMNRCLAPEIETIFLMASEGSHFISSSLVKEIASFKGDVGHLVSDNVEKELKACFAA